MSIHTKLQDKMEKKNNDKEKKRKRELEEEVFAFDVLVKKKDGFNEDQVVLCSNSTSSSSLKKKEGMQQEDWKILSNLCLVPEGIKYIIEGEPYIFDTAEHIATFLTYGIPDQVEKWTRGSVMSDFVAMFGEDHGIPMKNKYGDMIGHIPSLVINPARLQLLASHGIKTKIGTTIPLDYDFWRPILHAKFSEPSARKALLATGQLYILATFSAQSSLNNNNHEDFGAKITYAEPIHDQKINPICTCIMTTNPKDCPLMKEFFKQKKSNTRRHGILQGKNRMGKYLMAIRSEIRLIDASSTSAVPGDGCDYHHHSQEKDKKDILLKNKRQKKNSTTISF